jgi:uncharacterized membrane protein YphA (DoxX/SURF4 family)
MSVNAFAKDTLAPLFLRLALAAVFIYHGVDKVTTGDWGASWATQAWHKKGELPEGVTAKFDQLLEPLLERRNKKEEKEGDVDKIAKIRDVRHDLGILYRSDIQAPPAALGTYWAQLAVAWGELLGGVLLLFGFGSRLAALWLIVIQAGAIYTVTGMRGFSIAEGGGYEYNVVLLAMCLAVLCLGSGPLSLSRALSKKRTPPQPTAQQPEPVNV